MGGDGGIRRKGENPQSIVKGLINMRGSNARTSVRTYLQQQGSIVSENPLNLGIEILIAVLQSYLTQQQDLHGKHGKVE